MENIVSNNLKISSLEKQVNKKDRERRGEISGDALA